MESVNNLFGGLITQEPVDKTLWILPMAGSGDYEDGRIVTCPGGYKWSDFERIEVYFGWTNYSQGQSLESVTIPREQITLNPTGWFARSHVTHDEFATFASQGEDTAKIILNEGTTYPGMMVTVLGVKGWLKGDFNVPQNVTILANDVSVVQGDSFSLSESWEEFDAIEIEFTTKHVNNILHSFDRTLYPETLTVAERVSVLSYKTEAIADALYVWLDITDQQTFTMSVLSAGVSWSDFKIRTVRGIKNAVRVIDHFVGSPNENKFINPNMNVWQETLGVETTVAIDQHHADGWFAVGHGALTAHKHTDAKGRNWMSLKGGGTNSWKAIGQCIEAEECLSLLDSDNKLTVSYMYQTTSNDTNTHVACVVLGAGSKDDFTTANLVEFALVDQPIIRDGKEHLAQFTIDLKDYSGMNGLEIRLGSYNKASVNTPNPADSDFLITACKLEWGIHYTKCVQEKARKELKDCQRYYETSNQIRYGAQYLGSNDIYRINDVGFKVTKVKVPQITVGLNSNWVGGTVHTTTENGFHVGGNAVNSGAGCAIVNWTADARLKNA